ncbi:MAG: hypothetical protein CMJ21_02210 [Phycisphaerae bacterium]|nr:hypothetical protein [Phycisphaerae bacterium]
MTSAFWKTTPVLFRFKKLLAIAAVGAIISAVSFGVGMGTMSLAVQQMLQQQRTVYTIVRDFAANEDRSQWERNAASWALQYIPHESFKGFLLVMSVIAAMTIIGAAGQYVYKLTSITVATRATMIWRAKLFDHMVHAQLSRILEKGYTDNISRLMVDTRLLLTGYRAILSRSVESVLKAMAAVAIAFYANWKVTLVLLLVGPVIGLLMRKFGKRVRRATRRELSMLGQLNAVMYETMGGISVVKVHGGESYERLRFARANRRMFIEQLKARQARALANPVIELLAFLAVMAAAIGCAWMIFSGKAQVEDFLVVLIMLAAAGACMRPLTNLSNQLHESDAAAERILSVVDADTEPIRILPACDGPVLPRHHLDIVFENVTFTYADKDRHAVDDLTLRINHGQTIAIVGGNGAGKTTLVSLLPRLFAPDAGRILVDGVDIAQVSLRSLRKQMSVVTQQNVLFEGTIAQNIEYGKRRVPVERVIAASKAAFCHEFVQTLPQAYDTKLGEGGTGLSGGQRQRLCIARAILRDPAILILDEATSQIDADSESKINAALRKFRKGRTTFIVAHRLSTVIDADQIVVMDAGRIVGAGTHHELLDSSDLYRTLTRTQLQAVAV